jgi:membrane dipeptidase
MRLAWHDLGTPRADRAHGKPVEIRGWPTTVRPGARRADSFLLTPEPGCCMTCLPRHPLTAIDVSAEAPIDFPSGALRLSGVLHVETDDRDQWRYQLRAAKSVGGLTRRSLMAAGTLVCLPVVSRAQVPVGVTVDVHSHAGNAIHVYSQNGNEPFAPVAAPMRQGGLAVVCMAAVADSPTTHVSENRIRPYREPKPGELYAHIQRGFARVHRLAQEQGMPIIVDAAGLRAASADRPAMIVSCEGADFTEGQPDRVDEAHQKWQLRHLQLTHYRPNELGDIQTEPPVHGGLTDAGVEVIRRCNKIGVVVDVAHGTYELVKRAASVTTKPLVLSHTSLTQRPQPWTRLITPDHAKAVAATGGVIGIWPIKGLFGTYAAYAAGFARMVDQVGIDHVGLGTDQLGLLGPSILPSYADLPQLAAALRGKFNDAETAKLLGGNYLRAFEACLA